MAIPIIQRGDTSREITLALAEGYRYGGCTLEVEFNGVKRSFTGLEAGATIELSYTADETADMPLGTGRVLLSIRNAAGMVRQLPWAKIKVTDAPGEVYEAAITIDPASLDVEDATAGDSLGAVKSKLNAVLAFLRGVAVLAVCALPCFGEDVQPLYTTPNDMPGDAPLMTNAAEYVSAKVAEAKALASDAKSAADSAASSIGDLNDRIDDAQGVADDAYEWSQAAWEKADDALKRPAPVTSVNGKTGAVALAAADVGAVSNFGPNTISGGLVDGVGYVLSRLALKNDGMGAPIDISPGSFGDGAQITLGGYAYGGRLIVEKGSSTGDPSFGAKIEVRGALASITKNGREVATEEAVTNIVKDLSLGGIWDNELEVWWTPRMENGSLTYYATTNVNLTAEGSR